MEKQIEILKNWLEVSDKFFNDEYRKNYEKLKRATTKTDRDLIDYHTIMTVFSFIKLWRKRLERMIGGRELPARTLKKLDNLPDLKTTHPNLLRG